MNSFVKYCVGIFVCSLFFIITIALIPNNITFADELKKGTINCDLLNSREIPDQNSTVMFKLAQDANVNVIGSYQEWVKITYKEYIGWTKKEYVNIDDTVVEIPKAQPKKAYINASDVNLRNTADATASIYEKLSLNQEIVIYEELNGWTKCKEGETIGWVRTEFVTQGKPTITTNYTQTKIGYIVGSNINVRKLPDIASESITRLANNKKVNVIAASGDWYNIQSGDVKGWVHKDFLKVITQKEQDTLTARKTEQERTTVATESVTQSAEIITPSVNNTSTTSDQVIEYAKKFLGTRYVYGGSSPSGFDCSGFVCYVYKNFGISVNRSSASMASNGVYVAKSNLKSGDLVFFDTNMQGIISHVGIYIGNGQFIQSASGSAMKVIISSLSEANYSRQYVTARRVLN